MEDSILRCAGSQSSFGRKSRLETCSLATINEGIVHALQLQHSELHFSLFHTQPW